MDTTVSSAIGVDGLVLFGKIIVPLNGRESPLLIALLIVANVVNIGRRLVVFFVMLVDGILLVERLLRTKIDDKLVELFTKGIALVGIRIESD